MRPLAHADAWDGRLPAVLVVSEAGPEARHAALRVLAARVLGVAAEAVLIRHEAGAAPRLLGPAGARLHLSSASRGGVAAVAVADGPVGIDVEEVSGELDPPWNVLHPAEREALRPLDRQAQARAFARVWSTKEAYLKALGLGLDREPASFAVATADDGETLVRDGAHTERGRTAWVGPGGTHALALVTVRAPSPIGASSG